MTTGEGAERAAQGTLIRLPAGQRGALMLLRVVINELLSVFGCISALLAVVRKVRFAMFLHIVPAGEGLLADGAFQLEVLLLYVAPEGGLAVAGELALGTFMSGFFLVFPQTVLL